MQTRFTRWLKGGGAKTVAPTGCNAWELKVGKAHRIEFSKLPEHQLKSLMDVETTVHTHKISDSAIGFKPFDCYSMEADVCRGWFVLGFYGGTDVYVVPVQEVFGAMYEPTGGRRRGSITLDWAKEKGTHIIL